MPGTKLRILLAAFLAVPFGFLISAAPLQAASKEKVLHSFNFNGKDGWVPQGNLIFDAAGNLYGTTTRGGGSACSGYGCGTVFELVPRANGTWKEKVLYSFSGKDGRFPAASLIFDAKGNLYGTTRFGGGTGGGCSPSQEGCGTVFELTPGAKGKWTEKVLYSFKPNGKDGNWPEASLIFDAKGNLYGTTSAGSTSGTSCGFFGNCGSVFELTPGTNGKWTEKVLHSFKPNGKDGYWPSANLIFDAAGNLYGTTSEGGSVSGCGGSSCGIVFELLAGAKGRWTEKVLHSFSGADGSFPTGGLIFDPKGNLYGTTAEGGASGTGCIGVGCGTVFELVLGAKGKWTQKVLYSFGLNGKPGYWPGASLIFDAAGNLYSTTGGGSGSVFELLPGAKGKWAEKVLHSFSGRDGYAPSANPIFDAGGNLYGTTLGGGTGTDCNGVGCGTVFEITP